jgi:formate dehydrogenase major subunit
MDLVKLEIDGKRIIADSRQTILEVARQNGIGNIPTLCHDGQLEPFSSCFLCVVAVKGARSLLPACSTRIAAGMVVETDTAEIRRSRKAALELMLSNHFADCIGPCQIECPAGVDIQGYIALAALGKYGEAIRLIKGKNPLPAVCGRVCTRPCEVKGCRRNMLDEAVGIDYIKRYLADLDLGRTEPWRPRTDPPNGIKIAVVGGGPAGLSCAYYLAVRGYEVRIHESLPEAGGMLRYGIPEYRLPKEVLDLEINQILDLGVKLSTNVTLGKDFTIAGLLNEGNRAVFVAIGAWESSRMRVQDEDSEGVLPGIDFLREYGLRRSAPLAGRVLVVGGGNTAIDCARTALRLGADEVRLLYRRTRKEMPANQMEIDEAEHEGVRMEFLVAPVRVIRKNGRASALECLRMELGEPDASGRRSPKPIRGSEFTVDCDYVIAAIGQNTQVSKLVDGKISNFLPFGEVLNLTRWQTIQVNDRTFETSVEGVFSGGDVVTGAATAIEAIAAGRKAAYAIDAYVRTGKAQAEPVEFVSRKDAFGAVTREDLPDGSHYPRRQMPVLPPEERVKSFVEVEQGYSAADLKLESARCLECGCVALFDCDLRRYATEYQVDIRNFMGEARQHQVDRRHPLITLDQNKCILCGRCVRMCSEVVGVSAFGFINRGFSTVIKPALGGALLDTDCVTCGLCIGTCPTGAITEKIPLAKPGPWPTTPVATVCSYCGVGCRFNYETYGESLIRISRHEGGPTSGNHCRKGRFGYDYIQAPDRLLEAAIRTGRELQGTSLPDAISYTAMRLKELCRKYNGSQIALLLSPRLSNEEIYLGQKLARIALGTHQVTTLAHLVNRELFCPEVVSTASYQDVEDAQVVVVINSELDSEHFTVDLMVKKAVSKGGKLVYIGPRENRTSLHADVFIRCADGTQPTVLLGLLRACAIASPGILQENPGLREAAGSVTEEDLKRAGVDAEALREAADILSKSILKVLVHNRDYRGTRVAGDDRLFAEAAEALGCSHLALREKSNMQGLLDMGASPQWFPGYLSPGDAAAVAALEKEWCVSLHGLEGEGADLAEALRQKRIKVAIVVGEDPLGDESFPRDLASGLCAADFLVAADLFETATTRAANVVLPLSSPAETSGTITNSERRVQSFDQAIPPLCGIETWQLVTLLAGQMGYRFKMKYSSVREVQEEMRRVIPLYSGLALDGAKAGSIWERSGCPLAKVAFDSAALGALRDPGSGRGAIQPVPTAHLDTVEARFDRWYEDLFSRARERSEAEVEASK